jgi:hypothetical protein
MKENYIFTVQYASLRTPTCLLQRDCSTVPFMEDAFQKIFTWSIEELDKYANR